MKDLYLHKLENNKYAIFGEMEYCYKNYKTVEVDGEIYSKVEMIDNVMDMETEYNNGKLDHYETNFLHYFGYPEITLYFKKFSYSHSMQKMIRYIFSENDYVYFLQFLDNMKLFPKELYAKRYDYKKYQKHEILRVGKENINGNKPQFKFKIMGYGFNNFVTIDLTYAEVVKYNIPKNRLFHNLSNYRWGSWISKLILDEYPEDESNKIILVNKFIEQTKFLYAKN